MVVPAAPRRPGPLGLSEPCSAHAGLAGRLAAGTGTTEGARLPSSQQQGRHLLRDSLPLTQEGYFEIWSWPPCDELGVRALAERGILNFIFGGAVSAFNVKIEQCRA